MPPDPTTPETKPETTPEPESHEDDPGTTLIEGKKFVPIEAISKVRQQRRDLKDQLAKKDEALAAQAEAVRYAQAAQPLIEALQKHPEVVAILEGRASLPEKTEPDPDPELTGLARALDLYDAHGKPDLERAKAVTSLIERRAQKVSDAAVEQHVKPLAASSMTARATSNLERLINFKLPDGRRVDDKLVKQWFEQLDPRVAQDETTAALVLLLAAGQQALTKGFPAKAEDLEPPLEVDTAGGGGDRPIRLGPLEQRAAKELGISDTEFAKTIEQIRARDGRLE